MAEKPDVSTLHPFAHAMVPEHRAVILQGAEEKKLSAGEILFREGHPANQLYLIHSGSVALETHVHGKGDVVVATVNAGQVLGWSWLVPPFVWNFQGRAVEASQVTLVNGGHLLVACEQNNYLGFELMKGISKVILDVLLVAYDRWLETGHRPVIKVSEPAAGCDRSLSLAERMAEHPFFHGMPLPHVRTVAGLGSPLEFEAGQMLCAAGELADGLYIVEEGRISIETGGAGEPRALKVISKGDALGWSSFCPPYQWHFNARAVEPGAAVFFKAADLRERAASDYHFGYEMTKRVTRMMLQHLQNIRQRMWEAFH